MGQVKSEDELKQIVREVDYDNSGSIEFEEFLLLLEMLNKDYKNSQFEIEARKAFNKFDVDGSGDIEISEIGNVIKMVTGKLPTPEQLLEIMGELDRDGDGTITFEEFLDKI